MANDFNIVEGSFLVRGNTGSVGINIWDKVFKNGPRKICGRQPLRKQTIVLFNFLKCCLPQISLRPFLNALSHMLF